jgi:membrane-associated phospholipid phosphatase
VATNSSLAFTKQPWFWYSSARMLNPLPIKPRPWLWPFTALVAWGVLALAIDMPVARWCLAGHAPDAVDTALQLSEVFGHGFGVVIILLTVAILDPAHRWTLPRLTLASLGAGVTANIGKLLVARTRPHHCDTVANVWETFLGWMPLGRGPSYEQGFPSSHTATAVGLAVGLAWLYPRGRWWFALLATLVALQRIEAGAHFVSDTLWGAAVGIAIGCIAIHLPSLGYLGNKLERWLGRPRAEPGLSHSPQLAARSRRCASASSISGTSAPRMRP